MIAFKAENPDREAADYADKIAVTRQKIVEQYGEDTTYQQWIIDELREALSGV
jgi:hypothetical protein